MHERLTALHASIAARVRSLTGAHSEWPCRKGCDACCRSLAAEPQLTEPEWQLVHQGLDLLPAGVRTAVNARSDALAGASRPIVCPMLDQPSGSCLIYEHRPVACRTYGFYVERDKGLFCSTIERLPTSDVVWGNGESVEWALTSIAGPARPLSHWQR